MSDHPRTLFLHPPSFEGFDGGAGARYQAKREIRSFWYPTWLAQPAALVPGSRLIDAPPEGLAIDDIRPLAADYELAVLHTSTPSFASDVRVAEALKAENPALRIGFVGAHVAVNPEPALRASSAIDFVARNEFDFTIKEVAAGRPLDRVLGLSFQSDGSVRHTPDRPVLENMDALPFVVDVYKRDLVVEHYAIGYLLHPYVSLYTGRGCASKCTFCLWPQTVGGHRYRTRSVEHVADEIALAIRYFPQVREYFFDDDTLTDDLARVEALARRLGRLGVTWSCNARANVPYETLKIMKDNGLRLLLVGYESGNQAILNNVKKGIRLDIARRFTKHAKDCGIKIHGTFILGLPGETAETIQETIRFASDIDPDTLQVSIAAPYPGTELYRQAVDRGWLAGTPLVDERGAQLSALSYPHLLSSEISSGTEEFYRRFYFRPRKIFSIVKEMVCDRNVMRRRLRDGRQFVQFIAARKNGVPATATAASAVAPAPNLQVVVPAPPQPPMVAAVPAAIRAAGAAAALTGVARIIVATEWPALPESWRRRLDTIPAPWTHVASPASCTAVADALEPTAPVLILATNTIPEPDLVSELLSLRATAPHPATWLSRGRPVATYYPEARALGEGAAQREGSERRCDVVAAALADARAIVLQAPARAWRDAGDEADVRAVERRLVQALPRPGDGYLARVDRRISIALSRRLIRTRITPNAITGLSLAIGLAGAALLAGMNWSVALVGVALLWGSCILDGCDGEVARLKMLTSHGGRRFDIATDHVLHLATFVAIVMHLQRLRPGWNVARPAVVLLAGVVLSMVSVSFLINRYLEKRRLGFKRIYERIASRDYIYLVIILTLFERLDWFVWAAAIGANVFWMTLCLLGARAQRHR